MPLLKLKMKKILDWLGSDSNRGPFWAIRAIISIGVLVCITWFTIMSYNQNKGHSEASYNSDVDTTTTIHDEYTKAAYFKLDSISHQLSFDTCVDVNITTDVYKENVIILDKAHSGLIAAGDAFGLSDTGFTLKCIGYDGNYFSITHLKNKNLGLYSDKYPGYIIVLSHTQGCPELKKLSN